ncbi:MAG TPA: hypothetical protein VLH38_05715 [Patescibacteria group bacterium]|nr:hypothetical protein [Patescibacteria group bacterium]
MAGARVQSDGKIVGQAGTIGSVAGRINFGCATCSVVLDNWKSSNASSSSGSSSNSTFSRVVAQPSQPAQAKVVEPQKSSKLPLSDSNANNAESAGDGNTRVHSPAWHHWRWFVPLFVLFSLLLLLIARRRKKRDEEARPKLHRLR